MIRVADLQEWMYDNRGRCFKRPFDIDDNKKLNL
jgi:hypothetical protein